MATVLICVICDGKLVDAAPNSEDCVSALPCGHVFHKGCICQWLKSKPTCPNCRQEVEPEQILPKLYFNEDVYGTAVECTSCERPSSSNDGCTSEQPWYKKYADELTFGGGVLFGAAIGAIGGIIASKVSSSKQEPEKKQTKK